MNRENQFWDIERQMANAFNRGDIDDLLKFFDPDVVCFSSTRHNRIEGLKPFRKTFHFYLNMADEVKYSIAQPKLQVYEDTAIVSFYWRVTLTKGNRRSEVKGRGSHVFIKQGDAWKIVHEHFSRAH